jgi:hypothetical protein
VLPIPRSVRLHHFRSQTSSIDQYHMRDYSFIISPIRATGQTPTPRIPRFAARRFLSATFRTIGTTSFPLIIASSTP